MKSRLLIPSVLIVLVVTFLSAMLLKIDATAQSLKLDYETTLTQTNSNPKVTLNLSGNPGSLDPALASDSNSIDVIEQLFIGLVDRDDETGEFLPELATSWTTNSDSTVYTFTLRNDIDWSDGNPVTAHDVRYGILRTLKPETGSPYAYILYIIENAADYNAGNITDPNLVGVTALNDTTLRIQLESPAAYLPSILTSWVARPMPQWAIETHGVPTWTMPANIVTNGSYLLTEWVDDDHILLDKNPAFYNAANVQIEQVMMSMVDGDTAWQMYLNDQLDTVDVPVSISPNSIVQQGVHRQPLPCTYYYGMVNNKPPFDDVRVRQAFAMSVNKLSLINNALGGRGQIPADHFAPPGTWGAPALGTVGLGYNPTAANTLLQSYLNDNNMTLAEFNALDITLLYNTSTGHEAIAAAAQQNWLDNLGVSVIAEDMAWQEYLERLQPSTPLADAPHMFRLGWCEDYPDENNWVYEVFNNQAGANRLRRGCVDDTCTTEIPQAFDNITEQAKGEPDPVIRKNLYLQAETILAEDETAYIPLYFYGSWVATRAYLERTYPPSGVFDISSWRITIINQVIETSGGSLTSFDGSTTLEFPIDTFTDTVVITHMPDHGPLPTGNLVKLTGYAYDATAVFSDTGQIAQPASGQTYTVTIQYESESVPDTVPENTLTLYYWDGSQWIEEPTSQVNTTTNIVTATPNHFSVWAIMGETNYVYLPTIIK